MDFVLAIPVDNLVKTYVRGHLANRHGRLVEIQPYNDRRWRKPRLKSPPHSRVVHGGFQKKTLKHVRPLVGRSKVKLNPPKNDKVAINPLLNEILRIVKNIREFRPREVARLAPVLVQAKRVLTQAGLYNINFEPLFTPPDIPPARHVSNKSKEIIAHSVSSIDQIAKKQQLPNEVKKEVAMFESVMLDNAEL